MDINHLWNTDDAAFDRQNPRCLSVNTILAGKYLVGPVLGQGGFGITYQGYDLNMETRIAIKEYFPVELVSRDTTTMTGDRVLSLGGEKSVVYQQGLQKYVDEARNVSQFSQIPGVVSVKDFFYENETAYIVMEYIEGQSLKDYLRASGGKLPEEEALSIMKPVMEALGKVHEAGIIHRDISPDNIMLTFTSEDSEGSGDSGSRIQNVKLIDFGAARMTAKNDQKSLTIILKHGYAPEEQYRTHGEQGPWTDVYAVCAVLYRMLTGETPVPAMDRLFQDELKNFEAQGVQVSAGTAEAILRGLAVKKEERIQSMQELIGALYEGTRVRRTGKKGKRKACAAAGIGAAAVLAAVGIMAGIGSRRNTDTDVSATQERYPIEQTESPEEQRVEFSEEETLGEQIVFYTPQRSISGSVSHVLFCLPDGTVEARGSNAYGQCDVEDWTHVAAVCAAGYCSFGLRTDGTVLYAGRDEAMKDAVLWTDVVDLQASGSMVLGLHRDGTVSVISNVMEEGTSERKRFDEIRTWTGIKAIALNTLEAAGLREDGTVLLTGIQSEGETISGWEDVVCLRFYGSYYDASLLLGIEEENSLKVAKVGPEDAVNALGIELFQDEMEELRQLDQISQLGIEAHGAAYMGVQTDGTVFCKSWMKEELKSELESWKDMQAVQEVDEIFYGLDREGTIVEYWENQGNAESETMSDLQWVRVDNSGGNDDNLFALTRTGELLTYGKENQLSRKYEKREPGKPIRQLVGYSGILYEDGTFTFWDRNVDSYVSVSGVRQVLELLQGGPGSTYAYLYVKEDGTLSMQTGGDWEHPDAQSWKEELEQYTEALGWTDIVQIAMHHRMELLGLGEDGSVRSLSLFPNSNQEREKELELGAKIVKICDSEYSYSLLGLTEEGKIEVIYGESVDLEKGMLQVESWTDLKQLALGESHTVGLRSDGTVIATGKNYAGQCDVEDWTDIVYLTAGRTCTLGITADGDLKMAGSLY